MCVWVCDDDDDGEVANGEGGRLRRLSVGRKVPWGSAC